MVSLPNSSTKDVFKCCACVARVAAAERKKAGDLRTGSSLVQPISGRLAGMADFPKYFFRLAWRPAALVQTRYALHAAAMHRHMAKPEDWPYSRDCVRGCVLHAWLHRHFAHRSPCSVPTGYPTKVAGMENAMASCAALPGVRVRAGVCVGGWRQLRSEPRGKQKPERGNGDGKLTGEAGPALVAEIHRGYVVGGRSRVVGFLSVLCET